MACTTARFVRLEQLRILGADGDEVTPAWRSGDLSPECWTGDVSQATLLCWCGGFSHRRSGRSSRASCLGTDRGATFASMPTGEAIQAIGVDGADRAKRWLEGTTRVLHVWTNPEDDKKLTFSWASTGEFSFDLGGTLQGAELHGKNFFAEVKKYSSAGDQGTEYPKYLAKCYLALTQRPEWCDHFMWITWAPFSVTKWPNLMSAEYVAQSVKLEKHRKRTLGTADAEPDLDHCAEVARRLWLIVLSDKQEVLRLTEDERGEIFKLRMKGATT